MSKKGVSLIALIIVIIVIILLAVITFRVSNNIFEQAYIAKFTTEISDLDWAVNVECQKLKYEYRNEIKTEAQLYYMVATGNKLGMGELPIPLGKVSELPMKIIPENLEGDSYFALTTTNKELRKYKGWEYDKKYVTDRGEIFVLPGYMVETKEGKKWYINESKYYINDYPIDVETTIIKVSNIRISKDKNGTTVAGTNLIEQIPIYINFDVECENSEVTVNPRLPYEVNANGKYDFTLTTSDGTKITQTVNVTNYKDPNDSGLIMADIGLKATYTGDGSWGGGGRELYGSVAGSDASGSGCNKVDAKEKSTTLTFTNTLNKEAHFSFDYNITTNNGKVEVMLENKETLTGSGTYSVVLLSGETLDLTLESGKGSKLTTTIELTNIHLTESN